MQKIKIPCIVVAGPTSSGKSDLAIRLARTFNGEIVSADSRQVYRGMDIGTGKVSKREQRLVRHWLLDVASPRNQYSVARYQRDAQKAILDIVRRGKLPIICGGTGFWIDALVYGLRLPEVKPDAKLRARLARHTPAQLYARLKTLDPIRAASIDRHNSVRLIRALEIVITTKAAVPRPDRSSPYRILYLGVARPWDALRKRITERLDARLVRGMIAEIRRLHASGISWKRLEAFGLEYRWVTRYLQRTVDRPTMQNALLHDIIGYAKRQYTWWRKNPDIVWVTSYRQAERLAREFLAQ
ncbi:MAG TPA: tRNA (adenosine(37)-N6)-dimethylallyltransferase MiaA [Candidatus Paceibacterota bacterium]|nr:tRNA (adenosine(37)-N6)-dimethylallyltransferase MiaA [Candidatus Paceibacterota bacterium]